MNKPARPAWLLSAATQRSTKNVLPSDSRWTGRVHTHTHTQSAHARLTLVGNGRRRRKRRQRWKSRLPPAFNQTTACPSDPRQCDLCSNLRGYFPSYCRSLHRYKILQQKQHPSPIALLYYYSPAAAFAAALSFVIVVVVVVVSAALANTRQHPFYSDLIIIPISVFNSKPLNDRIQTDKYRLSQWFKLQLLLCLCMASYIICCIVHTHTHKVLLVVVAVNWNLHIVIMKASAVVRIVHAPTGAWWGWGVEWVRRQQNEL